MRYYRLEGHDEYSSEWFGIYEFLNPHESRHAGVDLTVPRCLKSGKFRNTRSWFTEKGWKKFSPLIFEAISEHKAWKDMQYRILVETDAELSGRLVMKGSIQAVENLEDTL